MTLQRTRPQPSTPLAAVDLHGCFAADRRVSAQALAHVLPESLFRSGIPAVAPAPAVEITALRRGGDLPAIGDIIDKYRIEELLGRGGFAAVYRATHLLMHAPVALKLLLPEVIMRHPHLAERMCDEARFTALVNHPNVVRVYDVTHGEQTTFIVMEYIEGASLSQLINHHRLRVEAVVRLGIEICSGLRAALERGLFHCDIKPANILIADDGHAKLVDFGQARRQIAGDETGIHSSDIVGTPAYMAPEQVEDPTGFDHRADIYALGATLYHALTGQTPFPSGQPLQIIYNHLNMPAPDPCVLVPECPPDLADLLRRMLAKSPKDRPGTYAELTQEFAAILDETQLDQSERGPAERSGRELFVRLRRLFAGGMR
jgi:serine/threonine protein kinase